VSFAKIKQDYVRRQIACQKSNAATTCLTSGRLEFVVVAETVIGSAMTTFLETFEIGSDVRCSEKTLWINDCWLTASSAAVDLPSVCAIV
jgi:hypothetical protein